jgi:ABC-type multidrug transport system ATPase subunit
MELKLTDAGKKYNQYWVFRNLNQVFEFGSKWVILGGNGSGKSTFLQVLAGYVRLTEGSFSGDKHQSEYFKSIAWTAPYIELYEELFLYEIIDFHASLKPFQKNLKTDEVIHLMDLNHAKHKPLIQFSSGMKQRVKLALAILSDTPILLLDEPVSNLDVKAQIWYQSLIENYTKDRTVIVCSNTIESEYRFCTNRINIEDFK